MKLNEFIQFCFFIDTQYYHDIIVLKEVHLLYRVMLANYLNWLYLAPPPSLMSSVQSVIRLSVYSQPPTH